MPVFELILIFIAGIAGGFYGSTVGGGALMTFPLLVLMGLPTPLALGTQRFGAVILELVSSIRFYRAKKLNLKMGLALGLIAVTGSIIGVNILISINPKLLNILIAILLLVVAVVLLNKDRLNIKERKISKSRRYWLALATALMGVYVGFFGAGAGVFWTLLLVIFGFSFIESAGIARVVGFCSSLVTAFVFGLHGLIDYQIGLVMGAGFAIGSWIGIGVTLRKGDQYVKVLLILVVAFSVIKLILNALGISVI